MNRYQRIIAHIFTNTRQEGSAEIPFTRDDIVEAARVLDIRLPKNLGDVIYTFRYRSALPKVIRDAAPAGKQWIIRGTGPGTYCFAAVGQAQIIPNENLIKTKIPDATPGVIEMYALSDEQALLAKLRYNRLIDIFTRLTCYSLQSHLRTAVTGIGQVETDELYVGVDQRGAQFVLPVQAKGGSDQISIVQIEQDMALCEAKFPSLICRPVASQFMAGDVIALFEFAEDNGEVRMTSEKHYRLVPPEGLSAADLNAYRSHPLDTTPSSEQQA